MTGATTRRQKPARHDAPADRATIAVRLVRSPIGFDRKQAAVLRGLGLRRLNQTVEVVDHPAMRGMIAKVRHLVAID